MIIGIDEVGRGCWAGPLLAAAVEFSDGKTISGLRDSKKMTKKQREAMVSRIENTGSQFAIGWVWPNEINKLGLTASVKLAMQRAIDQMSVDNQDIVIDGNINYLPELVHASCLVKADDTVPAVAAASVLAKVARDNYMAELSKEYPQYGFESHVGYGTKQHQAALDVRGAIETVHRLNYKPVLKVLSR